MTTNKKIAALRAAMQAAGVHGYLIPSSDPHMSEYLPAHWEARSWFSGFDGSAGTLAVTRNGSALWTDGRYFIQAARQLENSEIQLMRIAQVGTPEIGDWLAESLPENGVMGMDGMVTAADTVKGFEQAFSKKNITIKNTDLVTPIWQNRPSIPSSDAWLLDVQYAGKTVGEKLAALRKKLAEKHAQATLVSRLDSVAWLLNLRADDIAYNPFALAYCLILPNRATLFIDSSRLPKSAVQQLENEGVAIAPYENIAKGIRSVSEPVFMLCETAGTAWELYRLMQENRSITVIEGDEPVQLLKGVKNETEIKSIMNAHRKDGVAMVRFEIALEAKMAAGEKLTECDVSDMLCALRKAQEKSLGESFSTIAAYGANAAMMHYHPTPAACATLEPHGFLLVDSGGQYMDGTTDITRTYSLGPLTQEEKEFYTAVLKSHICMARAVFLSGCTGGNLDILARSPIWRLGIDYRCGTGHGVGFVGGVHEGPQSLRITNHVPITPGMTITDEPGIYEEGRVGIRIENELLCKEDKATEYGQFLCFTPITFCPIDTRPVLTERLNDDELDWINRYHRMVLEKLTPSLTEAEQGWLAAKCAPICR